MASKPRNFTGSDAAWLAGFAFGAGFFARSLILAVMNGAPFGPVAIYAVAVVASAAMTVIGCIVATRSN